MQQIGHDFDDESRYRQHVGSPVGNSPPGISCSIPSPYFVKYHICPDLFEFMQCYLAIDLCLPFGLVNNDVTAEPYNFRLHMVQSICFFFFS